MPYSQGKFSPLFLWRAHRQSGINDSIGRMQCDYKSMGRRKRLDLLAFEASAPMVLGPYWEKVLQAFMSPVE